MDLWVGTSGYSYKEWKGSFYPADIAADAMLGAYAALLPAVEINNTFYRMPKESVLEGWASQVPKEFRFVLKASRRITHIKRLKEVGDEVSYLYRTATALGPSMGVILFQMPPNFKKDLPRLEAFLQLVPSGRGAAFEFRHPSWFEDDVFEKLGQRHCALCLSDTEEGPIQRMIPTTDWGYLRLRKEKYTKKAISKIVEQVQGAPWKGAYVFFKDEGVGTGPKCARQFLDLAQAG
jgi:uncharacterized protein YecE (DUF72 family)